MSRNFKIVEQDCKLPDGYKGHFESKTPYAAAKKAIAAIYRQSNTRKETIQFTIQETTKDSAKNQYMYEGKKVKLSKEEQVPRMVKGEPLLDKNGKPVVIKYKYTIKSIR